MIFDDLCREGAAGEQLPEGIDGQGVLDEQQRRPPGARER
jgi:hypothetical protein